MERITSQKFAEYKNKLGGNKTGESEYMHDFAKIEAILNEGIQNNAFLRMIDVKFTPLTLNQAHELSLPVVSRTNTDNSSRMPKNYVQAGVDFNCRQVNFDTKISYRDLDKFADVDFEKSINDNMISEFMQNIIMIGFNGERWADDSDPIQNPLGQDVAKGWIAQLKEKGQMINAATEQGASMNQLIAKALDKLPVKLRHSGELIAICGGNLLGGDFVNVAYSDLQSAKTNNVIIPQKLIGGLKAINVSYFPKNAILVTALSNLAIYFKKDSSRLFFQDKPRENALEVYFSTNLDFLLGNHLHAVLIDGIRTEA